MTQAHQPIGVFDSGVGGLTVVRALREQLPDEALIYLGDTARVPYGTKSAHVVQRYAQRCADFLVKRGAKVVVVACNTASSVAMALLDTNCPVPVIGVIEPGAVTAARATRNRRVGVIGTEGTITSGSYQQALLHVAPDIRVSTATCPLLVPLAEEGLTNHPAARLLAEDYLTPLLQQEIDTLVLGCTHYPVLHALLMDVAGASVSLVDSATATAESVRALIDARQLRTPQRTRPDAFFATDVNTRLERVGRRFLGGDLGEVSLVDLPIV